MTLPMAAAVVFLALPLVAFRGRTLVRFLLFTIAMYVLAWILCRHARAIDPYLAVVGVFAVLGAVFAVVLACAREVRFSANRAAVIALLMYVLMIPAMLRTPIDGDEPFYLLITESMARDHDVDLRNQYAEQQRSATGRTNLEPQLGDPVGRNGEQYSRHEPFLPLLMLPGYLLGGLPGAIATIVIFGALLVRSTVRWMEDEGIDEATIRAVLPFFAFAPPVLWYAARIWPEVPGAFALVEALRGVRNRRPQRWVPAVLLLVLLKLRFALIGIMLVGSAGILPAGSLASSRRARAAGKMPADRPAGSRRSLWLLLLAIPLAVMWLATGSATSVHSFRELLPYDWHEYLRGFLGLLIDGMSGIAFQAPFYLLGLCALLRWREMPEGFRRGCIAGSLYYVYLIPRAEWHGGWAPPLRYIVVLMPVLALGAAAMWRHVSRGVVALLAIWTTALVAHGVAFPYRLFHIADGQNPIGEWLSAAYHADFGRLFPSLIRPNAAVAWGAAALLAILLWSRTPWTIPPQLAIALGACVLAAAFTFARRPGSRIEFEDAHVIRNGGALWPEEYTIARWRFRGGWVVKEGDALSFLARGGGSTLHYVTPVPSLIEVAGHAYSLPATADQYRTIRVQVPRDGRVELRCVAGMVNLDRMDHDGR